MATRPDEDDDDTLNLNEDGEVDGDDQNSDDDDGSDDDADASADDDVSDEDDDEPVISFGDEGDADEPQGDSLVKHLRQQIREANRRAAEAEKRASAGITAAPQVEDPGPKPTFADHAYDEDAFEAALDEWKTKKAKVDDVKASAAKAAEEAQTTWKREQAAYVEAKTALGFKDVDEVEAIALAALTPEQQTIIVKIADDSAKLIYALGKRPDKLKELAGVTDYLKFTKAVVNLERGINVSKRNRPDPDKGIKGNTGGLQSADKQMEKLEAEADRTGDRTKLIAYRAKMKK